MEVRGKLERNKSSSCPNIAEEISDAVDQDENIINKTNNPHGEYSDGSGTRNNLGFGFLEVPPWRNGFLRQVEQGFSVKCFGKFDDFSKFRSTFSTLYFKKIIKYAIN